MQQNEGKLWFMLTSNVTAMILKYRYINVWEFQKTFENYVNTM